MPKYIVNASPLINGLGTDDQSTRPLVPGKLATPQHLPLFFLFTKKGNTKRNLVNGAVRALLYGSESFDPSKKYFNHATLFSNGIAAEANNQIIERVIPPDANPPANLRVWVDFVTIPNYPVYERNTDGTIYLDNTGNPVPDAGGSTTPAIKVKFLVEVDTSPTGLTFGSATPQAGFLDDGSGNTSTRYPLFELKASSQGEFGNLAGIRLSPLTNDEVAPKLLDNKAFPYFLSVISKDNPNNSPDFVRSIFGENRVLTTFKKDALNPYTESKMDIETVFPHYWENVEDPRYNLQYSDFEDIYVYYNNIETFIDAITANEVNFISSTPISIPGAAGTTATTQWYDYGTDDTNEIQNDSKWLTNFATLKTLNNVPYFTAYIDTAPPASALPSNIKEFTFGPNSNIFMGNGSDGTMDLTNFNNAVATRMAEYLDPNSKVQETALNVESIIYDSGFDLNTKKELCNFIAVRRDTFVSLSTWDDSLTDPLSLTQERSIANVLRTRLELFPESDYFGTPVMRGMVTALTGKLRNSNYSKRVPLSYEIARKAARYMGAGNETWKSGFRFDGAPGSIVESLYDIQADFIPANVSPVLWDAGVNWAQPFDRSSYFFPALQTAYYNDTSVLNSFFTAMAICYINKVADRAWRQFSGVSGITNEQLAERVKRFVEQELAFKFDDRFIIFPEVFFTAADLQRGYSWTLVVKIGADNMKTVMTTWVESHRLEDLQQ